MDTSKALITLLLSCTLAAADEPATSTTNLTLHNLCPYPIWPLLTQNAGLPAIADKKAAVRLDGNGEGLATLTFPPGAWSGRVVARTGCSDGASPRKCDTGDAPPVTVAQLRRIKQFTMAACMAVTLSIAVLATLAAISAATTTVFTLHNICPYAVWPLVSPNSGFPAIATDAAQFLASNGLATLTFPSGAWSGRVVPRTGCSDVSASANCATGGAPPFTVAQVSVNGPGGLAAYSVSLVDGFNVPATVTPHGFEQGRQCPKLGCAVDLNAACPGDAKVAAGGCTAQPQLFKQMCPDARTTPTDVEATPQSCVDPAELKVVFCPTG